jgi:glutathione-regulated potassium-efflux system ancillary protein KefG
MSNPNRILILFAHPALEKSRINRHLIEAVKGLDAVTVHDLYEAYPNFHINVKYEQELLVLEYDFAYGHPETALRGKKFLSAITTGGGEKAYCREGYNRYGIRDLLLPFEQTAHLCGMEYLPPFVVYGTHRLQEQAQISPHVQDYRAAITALRDDTVNWEFLRQCKVMNQNLQQVIQLSEVAHNA